MPNHTLPAYEEAIRAGSDWVEFDVHPTKDGRLVIAHDIILDTTTNVASLFPSRVTTKFAPAYDGEPPEHTGYFVSSDAVRGALCWLSAHCRHARGRLRTLRWKS